MSDEELIAWLRDLAAVLGKDAFRIAADRIAALTAQNREMALDVLASSGQAQEAYAAQLAADAERDALRERVARLERAVDYILDGMDISAPEYAIDPDDDFLDAANADWVRDTLSRLAAALTDGGKDG